jgi:hypothetical protein
VRPEGLDAEYAGGALGVALERDFVTRVERIAAGASLGRLEIDGGPDGTRRLAWAEAGYGTVATPGRWRLSASVQLQGAVGSTAGESWTRGTARGSLGAGPGAAQLRVTTEVGATGGDAPAWERFAVGGPVSPLVDPELLSQRLPLPAVPVGYVAGERIWTLRVEARGGGGLTPFWWAGTAGEELGDWKRVIGLEWVFDRDGIPYLGLPATRLEAGVARVLDEPLRKETRGWLSLSFRP